MVWTTLIALAALALGIYNAWVARQAPAKARQQQLWDELRSVIEPLPPLLDETRGKLGMGKDVDPRPESLADAERRLTALAPRFTEPGVEAGLVLLTTHLAAAWLPWTMAVHHQQSLASMSQRSSTGEFARKVAEDRERETRGRDAAHRNLGVALDKLDAALSQWIGRLNQRDKRGK